MLKLLPLGLLLSLSFIVKAAETVETKDARKIMEQIKKISAGFIGSESQMKMTLIDAYNNQVVRELDSTTLEGKNDEDKSITEFTAPLDVKGTKLLTWAKAKESNELWLYLPKFKRVKKINSNNQSGSFMGSEFSYEDIAGHQLDKYTYKLLNEDPKSWVIEFTPTEKSGYSYTINTYSKEYSFPTKVEYYDRKKELLKLSNAEGLETHTVNGKKFYFPSKITMKNVQTKKSSIIEWSNRKMGIKHSEMLFRSDRLK